MIKRTLEECISQIPPSYYRVNIIKEGGYRIFAERNVLGGKLTVMTGQYQTWEEAFEELWGKI